MYSKETNYLACRNFQCQIILRKCSELWSEKILSLALFYFKKFLEIKILDFIKIFIYFDYFQEPGISVRLHTAISFLVGPLF